MLQNAYPRRKHDLTCERVRNQWPFVTGIHRIVLYVRVK